MSTSDGVVAVVVVSHNSAQDLPGLVGSLATGLTGLDWHFVLADNASYDDSVDVVRELDPSATIVEMGRNAGYAAGINAAVAAAPAHQAILILNPDVRLHQGCVAQLLDALGDSGVGITVPRLTDADGRRIDSLRREPTVLRTLADAVLGAQTAGRHPRLGEVVTDPARYTATTDVDWAEGSTQLVSAVCWQACGGWDESFFLYSEEAEFGLRARDSGFATRYVPEAAATHLEGESGSSVRLWPLLVVNRVRLHKRRHGLVRAVPFWLAVLLREASRAAMGRETSRAATRALLNPRRLRQPAGPEWLR